MFKKTLLATVLGAASLVSPTSFATTIALSTDGSWEAFDVDELTSASFGLEWIDLAGDPLDFTFTLTTPGVLRIVDAGFAGDTFEYSVNGALAQTSAVSAMSDGMLNVGLDFDAAFANPLFSAAEVLLGPGSYTVSGVLLQSAELEGVALNATVGGISVTAVPLPASALLFVGAGGILARLRRVARA